MSNRLLKVNSLIQRELSQLLNREIDLPTNCLATITRVDTSKDLKQTKIWVSVFPFFLGPQILKKLTKQTNSLHQLLKKKLNLKHIPRLNWQWDKRENEAQKIEAILDQFKKERKEKNG